MVPVAEIHVEKRQRHCRTSFVTDQLREAIGIAPLGVEIAPIFSGAQGFEMFPVPQVALRC